MIKGSIKVNKHFIKNNSCYVKLSRKDGSFAAYTIIDIDDMEKVLKRRWSLDSKGYVQSRLVNDSVKLHSFILEIKYIDHIDRNKLNNRKCNLRHCSPSEQQHNRGKFKNNTTGIKGISMQINSAGNKRWYASIRIRGIFYQKNCKTKKQAILQRKEWEKLI